MDGFERSFCSHDVSLSHKNKNTQTALNGGTSIARLGAAPPGHLWATTHVEGLVLWDWAAAADEEDEAGGVGPLAAVDDARPLVWPGRKVEEDAFAGAAIGCAVVGGGGGGGTRLVLALAPPGEPGTLALAGVGAAPTRGGPPALGPIEAVLRGGHTEAVRAWAWLGDCGGASSSALAAVTGGEDGRLALWRRPGGGGGGAGPATPAPVAMHAGAPSPPSAGEAHQQQQRGGLRAGSVRRGRTPSSGCGD
jgi:hypothetical protein